MKEKIFNIIQIGDKSNRISRAFDIFITFTIICNIIVTFLETFEQLTSFGGLFTMLEHASVLIFCIEYALRIWTADYLYPEKTPGRARFCFLISFDGVVDLLTIIPVFFLSGFIIFRMLRVARIFHLFRLNAKYDSFNIITTVLYEKRNQIISSVFIVMVLMLASSMCMYSVEHNAQPDIFRNAFSGIWWSMSTLLTVGYGDIYPITTLGKTFGILIAFLGVGMVAIPTGIISAGFVEQYQRIQKLSEYGLEADIHFVQVMLKPKDEWCGRLVRETALPSGLMIAVILRGTETKMPHGDIQLRAGDRLILSGESPRSNENMELKEIVLHRSHPWVGERIRSLDISRRSFIVLLKRHGRGIVPKGNVTLMEGDRLTMYTIKEGAEEPEELPRPIV